MFEINLLNNNIPNKIDIPKKSKFSFVKFLTISGLLILAFCFAIFAGFYLSKKEISKHAKILNTPIKNAISERKEKKIAAANNTFSFVVKLENATSNSTKIHIDQEEPIVSQKPVSIAKIPSQEIPRQHVEVSKQIASKPHEPTKVAEKACFVFCSSDSLKNLKSILEKKQINFTVEQIGNFKYNYIVYAGGLEKSKFLDFKRAIKEKGYNVVSTKILNGKYYADLGKMDESEKNNFLSAWKNLGFEIVVDKRQELSNKKYEVRFSCTKDFFEELNHKGFDVKTGRGAAW